MDSGFVGQVIGGTEDQLSSIFKSVLSSGQQKQFLAGLREFAVRKEGEIEALSRQHYQALVNLIDRTMVVRQESSGVKEMANELNRELQLMGETILIRMQENLHDSLAALQDCIAFMKLCQKVESEITAKKYFSALKTLDMLPISKIANFVFADLVSTAFLTRDDWIPLQRERIKEAVMAELKQWLAKVRDLSGIVGEMAMEQFRLRHKKLSKFSLNIRRRFSLFTANSMEIITVDDQERDLLNNELVKINFKSLYQCLHIYECLGLRNEFQAAFSEIRKMQATNLFVTNLAMKEDLKQFEGFLNVVTGFFIMEHYIINSPHNFHTRTHSDNLWEQGVIKINAFLSEAARTFKSVAFFKKLKATEVVFIQTMDSFSFSVSSLVDTLINLFSRYVDTIKVEKEEHLSILVNEDDFSCLSVPNDQVYENYAQKFKFLTDTKFASKRQNRLLPFSKAINACFDEIIGFIEMFYDFLEGIPQQNNELDDLAKKTIDSFIANTICDNLLTHVKQCRNIAKVVQILANIDCLGLMCGEIEAVLASKRAIARVTLSCRDKLAQAKKTVEFKIFELVNIKVDEFISLSKYERMPSAPSTTPSQYLRDIVDFLSSLCGSTFDSLPDSVRSLIYFDAFNHLATLLSETFMDPSAKQINFNFIKNFELDIMFLLQFIESLNDPNLYDAFAELDQTIRLLSSNSIHEFLDASVRNKKYSRVKVSALISLCQRIKEPSQDALSKQRQRMIEDFLKIINH